MCQCSKETVRLAWITYNIHVTYNHNKSPNIKPILCRKAGKLWWKFTGCMDEHKQNYMYPKSIRQGHKSIQIYMKLYQQKRSFDIMKGFHKGLLKLMVWQKCIKIRLFFDSFLDSALIYFPKKFIFILQQYLRGFHSSLNTPNWNNIWPL